MMPRCTTDYVISGTKFLRLASRKLEGYGTNMENWEKGIRRIFVADPGKVLCQSDQYGAEALIVAYLTRHGKFRDLFLNGIKPHIFVALHLFRDIWKEKISSSGLDIKCDIDELCDTPISDLRKNPFWNELAALIQSSDNWPPSQRYYYISKQVCHSSNYGIKAGMFCLNTLKKSLGRIVLKKQDADRFLSMYHGLFPEIREWHQEVEYQVRKTRMLFNLLGDPIYFSGDIEISPRVNEWYSAIAQSTVGCITRRAFTKMQDFIELSGLDWDNLQDNHDSFVTQCPEGEERACVTLQKSLLAARMKSPKDGTEFFMKSEAAVGRNWAPYHEIKNPDGLKEYRI